MGIVFDEVSADIGPVQKQAEPDERAGERSRGEAKVPEEGVVCECERRERRRLRLTPH